MSVAMPIAEKFTRRFTAAVSTIVADDAAVSSNLPTGASPVSATHCRQRTRRWQKKSLAVSKRGGPFVSGFSAWGLRLPASGVKKIEYGRELSHFSIHKRVITQTVWFERW